VEPFAVVYEDVSSNHSLVQNELIRYLGLHQRNDTAKDIFQNTSKKKKHSKRFCDNEDVDCQELEAGLKESYPCLYKQLVREEEGFTWSVPMLPDGTISIHGDCIPLDPLSEERPIRTSSKLYQLP
jgi:hypothetical protein